MTKTHRIITEEEYNTDGTLIHKTVTEETEEWEKINRVTAPLIVRVRSSAS